MKEHNGEVPQNARININYRGKKPKVSFKYPIDKKNTQTMGSMAEYFFILGTILSLPGVIYYGLGDAIDNDFDKTRLREFSECVAEHPIETLTDFSKVKYEICKEPKIYDNKEEALRGLLDLFLLLLPLMVTMLVYFVRKKEWDSKYPDFKAWEASKKYRRFTKVDIQEKDGRMFVELPVFNNVVCDFTATRGFNKYMEEFDITEHKFKYYKKRKCKLTKKKKMFHNEVLFYAKWYFKERPEDGYLEVIFK